MLYINIHPLAKPACVVQGCEPVVICINHSKTTIQNVKFKHNYPTDFCQTRGPKGKLKLYQRTLL